MQKKNDIITQKLIFSIIVNALFTCFEYTMGMLFCSLSLMADALQNLTDTCSLSICLFGHIMSKKKPSRNKTYGYGRAPLIAALCNSIILLSMSLYIFKEAYIRFFNPEPLAGAIIMGIGSMGILVNGSIALLFKNHRANLNIKTAFTNIIFDAVASAAAILAGFFAYITQSSSADTIMGIIIGCLLLVSAFKLIAETFHLLLDGVPPSLDIAHIEKTITCIPAVHAVHDLHIWNIAPQKTALSCQVTLYCAQLDESIETIQNIKKTLAQNFYIYHTTIEPQCTNKKNASCSIMSEHF